MRLRGFYFSLFLLTALVSCTYKTTDEYFREISLVPPKINFSNSSGPDTIFLTSSSSLEIHVDPGGTYKYYLEIFVDGVKKYSESNVTADFSIPGTIVSEPGTSQAHLVLYADTKSGSIVEALGTEAFIFKKDITIVKFPGDYYLQLVLSSASGNLTGTVNFAAGAPPVAKIIVSKEFSFSPRFEIASGTGPFPFIFYDSSYMGERAGYSVKAYFGTRWDTTFYSGLENGVMKDGEFTDLVVTAGNTGMPVIQWQKTSYPSHCAGYRISNTIVASDPVEIATITDLDKTSLEITDIGFPGANGLCVTYIPKNPPPGYSQNMYSFSTCNNFQTGIPSFAFTSFLNPVGEDFFTIRYDRILERYSAQTLEVTDNITVNDVFNSVSVSPNNKYLLASVNKEFAYLFYDIGTHSKTFIPAGQVIGSGFKQGAVSVSDHGVAAVSVGNRIVLYDFVHQQKLNETYFGQEPVAEISPSGKYFFVKADKMYLYSYSGGIIAEKWHSPDGTSGYDYFSFLPEDDDRAVVIKDRALFVRNCNDWSLVKTFPMDFTTLGNIDYNSRRIFGYDQEYFKIYDLNTGNLLKQMRVNALYGPLLKFRGNTLFCGDYSKLILF